MFFIWKWLLSLRYIHHIHSRYIYLFVFLSSLLWSLDKPEIKAVHGDRVEPDAGKTAYLKCIFIGSPMVIKWQKDNKPVPTSFPTIHHAVFQRDSSLEETLEIHNVRAEMYGRYDCIGTNKFGEATGHVELTSKEIHLINVNKGFILGIYLLECAHIS